MQWLYQKIWLNELQLNFADEQVLPNSWYDKQLALLVVIPILTTPNILSANCW